MRAFLFLFASTAFLPNTATAWGPTAHETIASIALRYLLPETTEWLKKLLPNKGSTEAGMRFISTWPDGYAHQCSDGLWSKGLHFIDAEDITPATITHPPLKCDVEYDRDCGNGFCVVGAIQNYTAVLEQPSSFTNKNSICAQQAGSGQKESSKHPQNHIQAHNFQAEGFPPLKPETLSDAQLAIRFIVHFIGDIHQPLHAEGYDLGGNGIRPVYFKGKESNLHALWDSQIPEAIFRRLPGGTEGAASYLYQQTKAIDKSSDVWKNEWVGKCFEGIEAEVAKFKKITPERSEACALQWATWANHYICTYVLQYGTDTPGMELAGDYTTNAKPIIVQLVSMAGWRLGGWLNLLATQKLGLDLGPVKEELAAVHDDAPMEVGEQDNYRGQHTVSPESERDEL